MLFRSHSPDHAFLCGDRVILLTKNKEILEGPVDEIVTAAGGTVYWHDGITDISYRGVDYTLTPKKGSSSAKITWTDPQGVEQTYESECEGLYTNICTRQGFVTDVLGIALERDVENNRLILKP